MLKSKLHRRKDLKCISFSVHNKNKGESIYNAEEKICNRFYNHNADGKWHMYIARDVPGRSGKFERTDNSKTK